MLAIYPLNLAATNGKEASMAVMPKATTDLWQRLRLGFQFSSEQSHPRLEQEIKWFRRHSPHFHKITRRARPYLHFLVETVEKRQLPLELALLPAIESGFDPFAYSKGQASGLWQFIPITGERFGLNQDYWVDNRRHIIFATHAALDYLETLYRKFDHDWLLALAAYNTGEGNLSKRIARNRRLGLATDFWSLTLPRETMRYVPRLLALAKMVANPEAHGLSLKFLPNQAYFTAIQIPYQIDLAVVAELSQLSIQHLYALNPAYNRWATSPDVANRLLIPVSVKNQFLKRLIELPAAQRIQWRTYRIRSEHSLFSLARRFDVTARLLRDKNNLGSNQLPIGERILVPVAKKNLADYSGSHFARLLVNAERQSQQARQKQPTLSSKYKILHRVQADESLFMIAQRYGTSLESLCRLNDLSWEDDLTPGQVLTVEVESTYSHLELQHCQGCTPIAVNRPAI